MAYQLGWEAEGIQMRFSGMLTSVDLIKANSELVGNRKIDTAKYIIVDFLSVQENCVDMKDVEITKDFSVRTNPLNPMVKVAIVSSRADLNTLIEAFIYATKNEIPHAQYGMFGNMEEASAWIHS